jgi:hypothetical protein
MSKMYLPNTVYFSSDGKTAIEIKLANADETYATVQFSACKTGWMPKCVEYVTPKEKIAKLLNDTLTNPD